MQLQQIPRQFFQQQQVELTFLPVWRDCPEAEFIRRVLVKKCAGGVDAYSAAQRLDRLLDDRLEHFERCPNLRFEYRLNEIRFIHRRTGIRISTLHFR